MKWLLFVAMLLAATSMAVPARTVVLDDAKVAEIKTALGYSTILQFDSRPTSAVLGDQDAFKVEYVGNSLTIKPLLRTSKSNLFVFTDYDRFNFRLVTTPAASVDYIVKVKRTRAQDSASTQQEPGTKLITKKIRRMASSSGVTLQVESVAYPKTRSSLVVSFRLLLRGAKEGLTKVEFEPGDIFMSQNGKSVPIENLYLDQLVLTEERPVNVTAVLRRVNYAASLKISFSPDAMKKGNTLRVQVPLAGL